MVLGSSVQYPMAREDGSHLNIIKISVLQYLMYCTRIQSSYYTEHTTQGTTEFHNNPFIDWKPSF
jgi:hypothetical protein